MLDSRFVAITERRSLDNTGLNAALVGAVDTGVLRWNATAFINSGTVAGTAPTGTWEPILAVAPFTVFWATHGQTANNGTTIKLTRRGQWLATFSCNVPASQTASFGISYQTDNPTQVSTPGLLAANTPINTAAGIRQGVTVTTAAATVIPVTLTALITVCDRDAGDGQSGIIRFHGSGGGAAGLLEAADVTAATVRYTVAYVGDVMGN